MKIEVVGKAIVQEGDEYAVELLIGEGPGSRRVVVPLNATAEQVASQRHEPVLTPMGLWLFRDTVVRADHPPPVDRDEFLLGIKHAVLTKEKHLKKMRREVEALERIGQIDIARRERIPEEVRVFVWRRDASKCVKCGSNQKLEFDHIIPVAEGGSSTDRNVQLLCEPCNRSKGKTV